MKIKLSQFLFVRSFTLIVLKFCWINCEALFLNTDESHINVAPFTSFNNDPVNQIDLNGKQPIYLGLLEDAGLPHIRGVIPLSRKDVNLNRVKNYMKHGKEPFLHPDALLPYQDIPFNGRLFMDVHGLGSTHLKDVYSHHFNYGDLTAEIEQQTGRAVESMYIMGCHASLGVSSSRNRILGKVFAHKNFPGELIKFRDVPENIEIFASPYKVISEIPELGSNSIQTSAVKGFLRFNDVPVKLYHETLFHPNFRYTSYHREIFDRYQYGQFFPAERNYVRTWVNQQGGRRFRTQEELGRSALSDSEFIPHSVVE